MWRRIALWFGLEAAPFDGSLQPLERQMADDGRVWTERVTKFDLAEADLNRLISPWHPDDYLAGRSRW